MKQRVIIAGGSGFVGGHLSRRLVAAGYEVIVLSRSSRSMGTARSIAWDGQTYGPWAAELDGAFALINLAGKSINCRHTKKNRRAILQSRVDAVRVLGQALQDAQKPPPVFVQSSAVGIYGNAGDRLCPEDAPHGIDFMAQLCESWEGAFNELALKQTRKVVLRLGVVLHPDGGFLKLISRLTRLFLGGQIADGSQYISWIHMADLCHMVLVAVEHAEVGGIYNACAPNPTTNREFMAHLRETLHRPWSPPVPRLAVKIGSSLLGTDPSLALVSQRAIPGRFVAQDFPFQFRNVPAALQNLLSPDASQQPSG